MAIVKCLQNLFEDLGSNLFAEELFLDNPIKKLTTCAQLCDKVHIGLIFEVLVKLDDVWVVLHTYHENINHDKIPIFACYLRVSAGCGPLSGISPSF